MRHIEDELSEFMIRNKDNVPERVDFTMNGDEVVMLHHLTSPVFLHQDLIDPQVSDGFVESGLGTLGEFATRVDALLRDLPVPEEPREEPPGAFTLQCGSHEAFTSNENVFTIGVNGANYNEIVWNWWSGAQPQRNFVTWSGSPTPLPDCPPPD